MESAMSRRGLSLFLALFVAAFAARVATQSSIGREVAIPRHLADGEELTLGLKALLDHGKRLFAANWTSQEGGGRPLTKGNGQPLSDLSDPLIFPRNFNRISAPDANSCAGCHNLPFGVPGGGGDIVANVAVLGQRFDFTTFGDVPDGHATKGTTDETGRIVTLQNIANSRNTLGMFGSGFVEMLARQITSDLRAIRDRIPPGGARALTSKGISFGVLARNADGTWNTSGVEGLSAGSLASTATSPPSLVIKPFHQAGAVVSLREFSNNAFNHHHGIQATERFGKDPADPDGDSFVDEMTRADVTAVSIFQATLAVPGRVIPNDPDVERAVLLGERKFSEIGCASCHIPSLPLTREGWVFTEPNPFNPPGNLRPGEAPTVRVDLTSRELPTPRLDPVRGVVHVPAFTDFKLHDICADGDDPNAEPLDMHSAPPTARINRRFITRKLWGTANEPPFFHHGQFTTLREAILAHNGEALGERLAFQALSTDESDAIVEFLKTLQILPPGTRYLIVDENGHRKRWPPRSRHES
jgi:hypothetical protein